jgi:DNA invertase Pin-like site-specific DNA recombinase
MGRSTVSGPEIQEGRFRQLCEQRGWQVAGVYRDRASGRKETRPELTRLMQDARRAFSTSWPWSPSTVSPAA